MLGLHVTSVCVPGERAKQGAANHRKRWPRVAGPGLEGKVAGLLIVGDEAHMTGSSGRRIEARRAWVHHRAPGG